MSVVDSADPGVGNAERDDVAPLVTDRGEHLVTAQLLMVMVKWGDRWAAGADGPPVLYRHHACGEVSQVELRCAHCGDPRSAGDIDLLPGPGADSGYSKT